MEKFEIYSHYIFCNSCYSILFFGKYGKTTGILGSIGSGEEKSFDISIKCSENSIIGDYDLKSINIQINDPINYKSWNDSVFMRFYKKSVRFIFAATGPYSFQFIGEDNTNKLQNFTDVAAYEPNNNEQTAKTPKGNTFFAYLHQDDIDYYKFKLK